MDLDDKLVCIFFPFVSDFWEKFLTFPQRNKIGHQLWMFPYHFGLIFKTIKEPLSAKEGKKCQEIPQNDKNIFEYWM